jgi:4-carboxymuconolactone decarboxylase
MNLENLHPAIDPNEGFQAGLAVRRKVLGDEYVQASLGKVTDFMAPLQQFITEHAWGTVWTREGLSLKTRSMLNLAILTAINRPHELGIHIRGAINNGVTIEEMQEIFLQCAVYCGAPAALDAFKTAEKIFAEDAAKV